ncbi:upf0394 inner membrane protein yeee-like [Plakobranchus ocellatus]|uniref:Upf0394 inner membrane protein yeee-like n=1 Tax=Plakobranchus ocellatus TaxID=259542 RepID=A0AAV4ATG3_9GAST|nr:upf0394 inner membrane protein yeee-like [Plakobranchus ocellatus]
MPVTHSKEKTAVKYLTSSVAGVIFGFTLEKGRVFEPIVLREQMLMTNFTMLKMFLSASATAMLSFSVLMMIPGTCNKMDRALNEFVKSLGTKTAVSAALGGAILGCGMTLAGSCPGMVLIQVGAAVQNAWYTLLGALFGALLYALTECSVHCRLEARHPPRYHTVDQYLESPYFNLVLPLVAMIGTSVFALELLKPWTTEVEVSGDGIFATRAWPPYVAGVIVGLLQIPLVLTIGDTLGTTSGLMALVARTPVTPLLEKIGFRLTKYRKNLTTLWQIFFMGGAIGGAFLSSTLSNTRGSIRGVHPLCSFGGGLLMIYGSRVGGGCTSGHGLSGMGLMMLLSVVAVPAMFGAGISTAFLLKHVFDIPIDQL